MNGSNSKESLEQGAGGGTKPVAIAAGIGLVVVVVVMGAWLGAAGARAGASSTDAASALQVSDSIAPNAAESVGDTDSARADVGLEDASTGAKAPSAAKIAPGSEAAAVPNVVAAPDRAPYGAADRAADGDALTESNAPDAAVGPAEVVDSAAVAAPDADPQAIELYRPTRAESEPEGLSAAEDGRLGQPALVMFHADWCHVCQEVMPTVHDLRDRYDGRAAVIKLDVDDGASQSANQRYRVRGTPTFVVFAADGTVAQQFSGWPGETAVAGLLDQLSVVQ